MKVMGVKMHKIIKSIIMTILISEKYYKAIDGKYTKSKAKDKVGFHLICNVK